jgi:CRISPR-associated protein (TIGR02584 family)
MARQVLLATLGTTPQILTEAVYFHKVRASIQFDEIHVITTRPGRDLLLQCLFGPVRHPGNFGRLCKRLGIPYAHTLFSEKTITVLRGSDGTELDDIRNSDDSEAAADQILAVVRRLCDQPDLTIHATLAGGRKTMGVYLHSVLQLIGRPQDCLFHVLTHPAVETEIARGRMKDFFYPLRDVRIGGKVVPRAAMLDCVEIPLLHWPQGAQPDGGWTYRQLVEHRQAEIRLQREPSLLTIDCRARALRVSDRVVKLKPSHFFWYCHFAQSSGTTFPLNDFVAFVTIDERTGAKISQDAGPAERALAHQLAALRSLHARLDPRKGDGFWRMLGRHCQGKPAGLVSVVSGINAALKRELGTLAGPYLVEGGRGSGGYRLGIPQDLVKVVW